MTSQCPPNYVEASSENCGHVKFLCPGVCQPCPIAPPTGPPDTLEAKSSQNTDTGTKSISVLLIVAKSTNNWDQVAGGDVIILLLSSSN